jgi:hypothetical protein
VSSSAILKYGIKIAFTQETKPKIKNRRPIMRMEINVLRLVKEPASIVVAAMLLIVQLIFLTTPRILKLFGEHSPRSFIKINSTISMLL